MTPSHVYLIFFLHVRSPLLLAPLSFLLMATLFPVSQLFHTFLSFVMTHGILLGFLEGLWERDYLQEYGLPISGYTTEENAFPFFSNH